MSISLIHEGLKIIIKGGLRIKKFSEELTSFIQEYPEVWKAHEKTGELVHSAGPLDKKTCHLIQLGMAASAQLHGAVCALMSLRHLRLERRVKRFTIPSC